MVPDKYIIEQFKINKGTFISLLNDATPDFYNWRPKAKSWCLLEVLCHLYDEERLDFRFRTQWVLERPGEVPPAFNPLSWVEDHRYMEQDFSEMLAKFLSERDKSIKWLESLENPQWDHAFLHPKLGSMSAGYFLSNWLAHDYLHFRQITKLKFNYLSNMLKSDLNYAGPW